VKAFQTEADTGRAIAAWAREEVFARAPEVDAILTVEPEHVGYLSGYRSMAYDTSRTYVCAAVATRDATRLVLGAADAAPALEVISDPKLIFRYGRFFFENYTSAQTPPDVNLTYAEALSAALRSTLGLKGRLGVDQSGPFLAMSGTTPLISDLDAKDVSAAILDARIRKSHGEIDLLRQATHLVESGITAAIAWARAGMTENALAAVIAGEISRGGGVPRFIAVTSGHRSALADAYPTSRKIEKGDLVRLDIGCTYHGYWADMARTACVGEPSPAQKAQYDAIRAGLEHQLEQLRAGQTAASSFEAAVTATRRAGLSHYQRHHCGHGIGLQPSEFPRLSLDNPAPLEANMVLCVETPYYEIGRGGMMVEDTVVVTDDGYAPLTTIARDLSIIPA
jgi:Xaa-Pro dipeptidase